MTNDSGSAGVPVATLREVLGKAGWQLPLRADEGLRQITDAEGCEVWDPPSRTLFVAAVNALGPLLDEVERLRREGASLRSERDALAEFWSGAVELTMEPDSGDPDAETLLEYALDAGLIVSEPYDPAKHGEDFNEWADEGDPIRVLSKLGSRLERVGTRLVTDRAAANALAPEAKPTPSKNPDAVAEDR